MNYDSLGADSESQRPVLYFDNTWVWYLQFFVNLGNIYIAVHGKHASRLCQYNLNAMKILREVDIEDHGVCSALSWGPYDNGPLIAGFENGSIGVYNHSLVKLARCWRAHDEPIVQISVARQCCFFTLCPLGFLKVWSLQVKDEPEEGSETSSSEKKGQSSDTSSDKRPSHN